MLVALGIAVVLLLGGLLLWRRRRHRGLPGPGHLPLPETGRSRRSAGGVSDAQHTQDWWEGGKRLPGQKF